MFNFKTLNIGIFTKVFLTFTFLCSLVIPSHAWAQCAKFEPSGALSNITPYDNNGKCFFYSGKQIQLLDKSRGLYTLGADSVVLLDFGGKSTKKYYEGLVKGLGEYSYQTASGVLMIVHKLGMVSLAEQKKYNDELKRQRTHSQIKTSKIEKEKQQENLYIDKNMLNFDEHMPLFAGLRWDDKFSSVLKKIRGVNSVTQIHASFSIDEEKINQILSSENNKNKTTQINKILDVIFYRGDSYGDVSVISYEDSKVIDDLVVGCSIYANIVLFDSNANLDLILGGTGTSSIVVPYYLKSIKISNISETSSSRLIDAYNKKYSKYNEDSFNKNSRCDLFGNCVKFGGKKYTQDGTTLTVYYVRSEKVEEMLEQIIKEDNHKREINKLKLLPQADSAL